MASDEFGRAKHYAKSLDEIAARLECVTALTKRGHSGRLARPDQEFVALNLRKSLELIAFGALSANKAAYSTAYKNFAKHWKSKALLDDLEKIHPPFYPEALLPPKITGRAPRQLHFDQRKSGFLTRSDFVELYDECSGFLHTRNPFSSKDLASFSMPPIAWAERIERLLEFHSFRLAGLPQRWLGELKAADGKARVYIASPT